MNHGKLESLPAPIPGIECRFDKGITCQKLAQKLAEKEPPLLINVGYSDKHRAGHIPGAVWTPRCWLERVHGHYPHARVVVITSDCEKHARLAAADAERLWPHADVRFLKGGTPDWAKKGFELETGMPVSLSAEDDVWYLTYKDPHAKQEAMETFFDWDHALAKKMLADGTGESVITPSPETVTKKEPTMADERIQRLKQAILDFDEEQAVNAAKDILEAGLPPIDGVNAMGDALNELGVKFQAMEVFLPEVLLASDAFKAAMSLFEPELLKAAKGAGGQERPKIVIGTVKGDVHTVGKDMVTTMLTVAGFDVKDLGVDVDSATFITEAQAFGAKLIGLSALMSTTMPYQKEVIEFLEAKNLRGKFKVMIGGGPCSQQWADSIGADGFSKDAVEAVALAKRLLAETAA